MADGRQFFELIRKFYERHRTEKYETIGLIKFTAMLQQSKSNITDMNQRLKIMRPLRWEHHSNNETMNRARSGNLGLKGREEESYTLKGSSNVSSVFDILRLSLLIDISAMAPIVEKIHIYRKH